MDNQRNIHRDAFTIIELLVVLGIIAILAGLILVGVQAARESTRRAVCQSNLRQIGMALHAYHGALGSLPPAVVWSPRGEPIGGGVYPIGVIDRVARYGTIKNDTIYSNWLLCILPQLERMALNESAQFSLPISHPRHAAVRSARLAVLNCQSDTFNNDDNFYLRGSAAGLQDNRYARGNYALNVGPDSNCLRGADPSTPCTNGFFVDSTDLAHKNSQIWGSGVGGANKVFRFADIVDGLSQTIAVDEIRSGLSEVDPRGAWALGQAGASLVSRHGKYSSTGGPNPCDDGADEFIGCAALRQTAGVGAVVRECMDCNATSTDAEINAKSAARSLHPGGVNALFCDGSVHFIANGVDGEVWHASHTRGSKDRAFSEQ